MQLTWRVGTWGNESTFPPGRALRSSCLQPADVYYSVHEFCVSIFKCLLQHRMREGPLFFLLPAYFIHPSLSSLLGGQRGGRQKEKEKEKERKREEEDEERGKRGRGKSPTRSLSCTRIATSESLSPRMLRSFTLAEGERKSQPIQFIHLLHLSSCSYTLYCSPDPMIVSLSSTIMHLLCTYTISVILRK